MPKKKVDLIKNHAGGVDLIVERDAGNEVRILTGKKANSKAFWEDILEKAEFALQNLENGE